MKHHLITLALLTAASAAQADKLHIVDLDFAQNTIATYYPVFAACRNVPGFAEQDFYKAARDDIGTRFDLGPENEDEIVFENLRELRQFTKPAINDPIACRVLQQAAQQIIREHFATYIY